MNLIKSDTIVILSTADWDTKYLTNKQHTAKELARFGYKVLYVESFGLRTPTIKSSLDFGRLIFRAISGLKTIFFGPKTVENNIQVLSPLVSPFLKDNLIVKRINSFLINFLIQRSLKKNSYIIWSYHPYVMDIMNLRQHKKIVYHCVDDLSSVPGIDKDSFNKHEVEFLKYCDYIFVTANKLKERCEKYNDNVIYLSNVVDYELFSSGRERDDNLNEPPKIIYHGVLSDFKLDFKLLYQIIKSNPQYKFIIVGEEREGQSSSILEKISKFDNVELRGYIPYHDLPSILVNCDLGILPSKINDYTDSMFPMKFYEFIAAGLPVLSTRLDAIKNIESDYIKQFSFPSEFSLAAEALLNKGKIPEIERKSLIGKNTWKDRTSIMLDIIDGVR